MLSMSCPVRLDLVVQGLSFTSPIQKRSPLERGVENDVDVLGELLATDATAGSLPQTGSA